MAWKAEIPTSLCPRYKQTVENNADKPCREPHANRTSGLSETIPFILRDSKQPVWCLQLLRAARINYAACTVSKYFAEAERERERTTQPFSLHAYCMIPHHHQQSSASQFNPFSSVYFWALLVMQPAFTQHNACYLPMCFEGYC